MLSVFQAIVIAQDGDGSTNSSSSSRSITTTTTETTWYAQPWVWVVGGIVLILLLIGLLRGNFGPDRRVTVTKTTSTE